MNPIRLTAVLLTAASLAAQSFPQTPAGLGPGDSYRVIVVTTAVRNALSADIADYDAFVQADIAASSMSQLVTSWSALASTPSVDAFAHTNTDPDDPVNTGVPIYLADGTLIANNNYDLWDGGIANAPTLNTAGVPSLNDRVWTGTSVYWGSARAPLGNTDPQWNGSSLAGNPYGNGQIWMWANYIPQTNPLPLYAISDVITIASHEERLGTPAMPDSFWIPQELPRIGQAYRPFIDHEEFVEDALIDVVFYGAAQTNVSLPGFGTVLIDQIFGTQTYVPTIPAGSFYPQAQVVFDIPNDPSFAGVAVSAQVLVLDVSAQLHLTNAIDFVIGSN